MLLREGTLKILTYAIGRYHYHYIGIRLCPSLYLESVKCSRVALDVAALCSVGNRCLPNGERDTNVMLISSSHHDFSFYM